MEILAIIVGGIIALIVGKAILAINNDDGQPWPHPEPGDEHQWTE